MRKISVVFILLSLFCLAFTSNNSGVNYRHKSLVKALQKGGITDLSAIEEIQIPDTILEANIINGKYFLINKSQADQYQYIYVGRVNSCRASGCSIANNKDHQGTSEYFDYYILFDKEKKVQALKVFNYQATHGHAISAPGWLKQFIGHDGKQSLQVNKNIDAISGATISVYAITNDVNERSAFLRGYTP